MSNILAMIAYSFTLLLWVLFPPVPSFVNVFMLTLGIGIVVAVASYFIFGFLDRKSPGRMR